MKKILFAVLVAVLAMGVFTGVANAQTVQQDPGLLHEYMEEALAEKLGVSLATIEAQLEEGKNLYQIALDHGIAKTDLPAFLLEVRTAAIQAALGDGVITQAQADRMLQNRARGMGRGMLGLGSGYGPCGGTGIPTGSGMQWGGRGQWGAR